MFAQDKKPIISLEFFKILVDLLVKTVPFIMRQFSQLNQLKEMYSVLWLVMSKYSSTEARLI